MGNSSPDFYNDPEILEKYSKDNTFVMDYGDPSEFERFASEAIKGYQSFYKEEILVKK